MPLNPITPGLHTFRNRTNDVAKVELRIPANHELSVSEDVAKHMDRRVFLDLEEAPAETEVPEEAPTVTDTVPAEPAPKKSKKG